MTTDSAGRPLIQKGGGSDDFASDLLYYPREHVVIVWASNNLRQRWRRTLNRTLSASIFDSAPAILPQVAWVSATALNGWAQTYHSGEDTLRLRAGAGYLYAEANRHGVPTSVMFFPQDSLQFTAFDPSSGEQTRLRFTDGSVTVQLPDGRQVVARQ